MRPSFYIIRGATLSIISGIHLHLVYISGNHITARCYVTSSDKFDNHVFKCSNENAHVVKEHYFKVYAFMTVNNENKLCYESCLHKMVF